ncbi:hypothetical protein [Devosia sediminis]|uniref:Uncharacterized protein n=1 Tax=Devosia sediminis TaxID=2798801 RepID=A0A934MS83_9HYPH|nr:hypothetical protein [Devosia sediminis]MBJ3786184.1 hypothetical protein [Devosia sediminis]
MKACICASCAKAGIASNGKIAANLEYRFTLFLPQNYMMATDYRNNLAVNTSL